MPYHRLLALLLFSLFALSARAEPQRETLVSNKIEREFYLVVPDTKPGVPMPLVLLLHGHGSTAANVAGVNGDASPLTAWIPIVNREHIVVAALQGSTGKDGHPGWNDCRSDAPGNPTSDDVRFAHDVIASLQERKLIDTSRIYVMGMSNGAMMAQRLALELDPPVAAFAAVSGNLAAHSQCKPASHPVSALLIMGTADPLVPYSGGQVHFFKHVQGTVMSAAGNVQFWRKADHLDTPPVTSPIVHRKLASNPTHATREVYGKDTHAVQVELVTVVKGGHVEPSLTHHYDFLYTLVAGVQNQDIESAEEAWQFFRDKRSH